MVNIKIFRLILYAEEFIHINVFIVYTFDEAVCIFLYLSHFLFNFSFNS